MSKQRLIRAVRLLPGAVRIGRGTMEDISAGGVECDALAVRNATEESELQRAQAEVRKLRSELRAREDDLNEARTSSQNLRTRIEEMKSSVEKERAEFVARMEEDLARRREETEKSACREGDARGYEEGAVRARTEIGAEYEARFSKALDLLAQIGSSLQGAREELAASHASQLIHLWETMLKKMLQAQVALDPAVIERQIFYILGRVSDRERIVVYLNPADVEIVENIKDEIKDSIRGVKVFEVMADEHVDCGSCLVETSLGIYDARWRTQLEQISAEIEELLMEAMSGDKNSG